MDAKNLDWRHLRPPISAMSIEHPDHYIKNGKGKKATRKIFESVDHTIDDFEASKILELEEQIKKEKIILPSDWTKYDTLKYCYSSRFNLAKSIELVKKHLEWRMNPLSYITNDEVMAFLKTGVIYMQGRDNQYRPIIIVNLTMVDFSRPNAEENYMKAIGILSFLIKKYTWIPGKVENWIIIMDTGGVGLMNFPFAIVKRLIEFTSINFTCCLEKLYILNPSFGLNSSWNIIKGILDPETAAKINFLKPSKYNELQKNISLSQLERKYGGLLPDNTEYWPPKYTYNEPQIQLTSENFEGNMEHEANIRDSRLHTQYYDCQETVISYRKESDYKSFKYEGNSFFASFENSSQSSASHKIENGPQKHEKVIDVIVEEDKANIDNEKLSQRDSENHYQKNLIERTTIKPQSSLLLNQQNDSMRDISHDSQVNSNHKKSQNYSTRPIVYENYQSTNTYFCGLCSGPPSDRKTLSYKEDKKCIIF